MVPGSLVAAAIHTFAEVAHRQRATRPTFRCTVTFPLYFPSGWLFVSLFCVRVCLCRVCVCVYVCMYTCACFRPPIHQTQIVLSFVLGVVVFGFLLVVFLYNTLEKGLNQIPGLGFMKPLNRHGAAAGVLGVGSMYALAQALFQTDATVPLPTLNGWTDSGIPLR